jgi:hypothetical protein
VRVAQVRELIGLSGRTGKPLQRFYPQCQRCSIKQATAMRSGKRVLVLHLHAPRYRSEHMAGKLKLSSRSRASAA